MIIDQIKDTVQNLPLLKLTQFLVNIIDLLLYHVAEII